MIVDAILLLEMDPTTCTVNCTESTLVCDQVAVAVKLHALSMLSVGCPYDAGGGDAAVGPAAIASMAPRPSMSVTV